MSRAPLTAARTRAFHAAWLFFNNLSVMVIPTKGLRAARKGLMDEEDMME
jgi:hypothetical protein